jgi:hypothetical protein
VGATCTGLPEWLLEGFKFTCSAVSNKDLLFHPFIHNRRSKKKAIHACELFFLLDIVASNII